METFPSPAGAKLAVKRLRAAQLLVAVRAACQLAEIRCRELFTRGTRLAQASRECSDLSIVTANLLLASCAATTAAGLTTHYGQARWCILKCEACTKEAKKLEDARLGDLVKACRKASVACREFTETAQGLKTAIPGASTDFAPAHLSLTRTRSVPATARSTGFTSARPEVPPSRTTFPKS